jgi:integrase
MPLCLYIASLAKDGYVDVMLEQKKVHKVEPKRIVSTNTPKCPVQALTAWLNESAIVEGAVFRRIDRHGNILNMLTDKSRYDVIKKHAGAAGLDASKYVGHSLISGFATHATNKGCNEQDIQNHLGHCTSEMTKRYEQEAKPQGKDYAALSIDLG